MDGFEAVVKGAKGLSAGAGAGGGPGPSTPVNRSQTREDLQHLGTPLHMPDLVTGMQRLLTAGPSTGGETVPQRHCRRGLVYKPALLQKGFCPAPKHTQVPLYLCTSF
jgi:hypothetical protein